MRITPLEIPSLSPNLEHTPNARSSKKLCRNFIGNKVKLILKNRYYKKNCYNDKNNFYTNITLYSDLLFIDSLTFYQFDLM